MQRASVIRRGLVGLMAGLLLLGGVSVAAGACATALLVVDAQNFWLTDDTPRTADDMFIVDKLVGVLGAAREAGLTIVYTKDLANVGIATAEQLGFPEAIAPQDGDIVSLKRFSDAFHLTPLDVVLRQLGVTRVLICGLYSSYCVADTVQGALDHNYDVVVIADGHGSVGNDGYEARQMDAMWLDQGLAVVNSWDLDYAGYCQP